jgi:ABC-type lipoprotein release transport system permease subunit
MEGLLTLPEHLRSPQSVFKDVRVNKYLVLCLVVCISLVVIFNFVIVLFVLGL